MYSRDFRSPLVLRTGPPPLAHVRHAVSVSTAEVNQTSRARRLPEGDADDSGEQCGDRACG